MADRPRRIRGMAPTQEVRPADEAELAEILARANGSGAACCIAGGGTKQDWGNRPDRFDYLLETTSLRGCTDVDADNLTLSATAGTTVAEARAQANAVNRVLPLDPGFPTQATIGGVTATGDQGARAAGYGGLRDIVLGVRATLADGSPVRFGGRTMKNVTGYDMTRLFVGSFGALGVITEVTFRLLPRYDTQALLVVPLPSFETTKASVARILGSYLQPLALEVVSADMLPAEVAQASGAAAAQAGSPVLLVGFAGHGAAVTRSIREVADEHPESTSSVLRDDAAETLYEFLADLGTRAGGATAGASAGASGADAKVGMRGSVPISRALDLVEAAERCCGAGHLSLSFRAGAARGRVDLTIAQDGSGPNSSQQGFADCVVELRARAVDMGGSLFITGGSALLPASLDAWGDVGPALTVMQHIKERLDPNRVLNPGRFVGGI